MDFLMKQLTRHRDGGLLLLRLGLGGVFIVHGLNKLLAGQDRWVDLGNSLSSIGLPVIGPPVFWGLLATLTEFLGGILLLAGFLFRPVLLALLGTMVIATLYLAIGRDAAFTQWAHPFTVGWVVLSLIFIGPGRFSVDGEPALHESHSENTSPSQD